MLRIPVSTAQGARRFNPTALQTHLKTTLPVHSFAQPKFSTSRTLLKSRLSANTGFTFTSHFSPSSSSKILHRLRSSIRSFRSPRSLKNGKAASPNPTANLNSPKGSGASGANAEPTSLAGRLRKLSREYGWSALGVYLLLSALDFPFCYLLVKYLGTDRIGQWEEVIISNVKRIIPESTKQTWHDWRASMKQAERDVTGDDDISEHVEMVGWTIEEADEANKKDASLATQLALAYAIHKSFIFIRVPLTAAVTPKVVKVLRGWGWDIGKRTTKEAKALRRASIPPKSRRK